MTREERVALAELAKHNATRLVNWLRKRVTRKRTNVEKVNALRAGLIARMEMLRGIRKDAEEKGLIDRAAQAGSMLFALEVKERMLYALVSHHEPEHEQPPVVDNTIDSATIFECITGQTFPEGKEGGVQALELLKNNRKACIFACFGMGFMSVPPEKGTFPGEVIGGGTVDFGRAFRGFIPGVKRTTTQVAKPMQYTATGRHGSDNRIITRIDRYTTTTVEKADGVGMTMFGGVRMTGAWRWDGTCWEPIVTFLPQNTTKPNNRVNWSDIDMFVVRFKKDAHGKQIAVKEPYNG